MFTSKNLSADTEYFLYSLVCFVYCCCCLLVFLFGLFCTETSSYSKSFVLKVLNEAVIVWGRHELLAWNWNRHGRIIEDHEAEGKVAFLLPHIICETGCPA